jgi:hypothetical protein
MLKGAFEKSCPPHTVKGRKKVPWWTDELTRLRNEARRLFRKTTVEHGDLSYAYAHSRAVYHRALRRAKRSSWAEFCATIEIFPEASRLYKVLKDDRLLRVGVLEKSDGSYTNGALESMRYLLEEHFLANPVGVNLLADHERHDEEIHTIISEELLSRAINVFGAVKAEGPDGIFLAMLQKALPSIATYVIEILEGCLALGYVPSTWTSARVISLPKPGKDSYKSASSWRPISLTSFLLKALERLIDWHIRTPELIGRLKASNQFAYMQGVSTEAALHQIVARIERTLKSGRFAVGVFLDIKGVSIRSIPRLLHEGCRDLTSTIL